MFVYFRLLMRPALFRHLERRGIQVDLQLIFFNAPKNKYISILALINVRQEFESHLRLLLFPRARHFTLIACWYYWYFVLKLEFEPYWNFTRKTMCVLNLKTITKILLIRNCVSLNGMNDLYMSSQVNFKSIYIQQLTQALFNL